MGRRSPMAAAHIGLWLALALLVDSPLAAAPETAPCADPTTNPLMSPEMSAQDLDTYQARSRALPPIALPRHVIATRDLALDFRSDPLPITTPGALDSLVKEAATGGFESVDCAEIAEIRGTVLCLFHDIATANLAFYRAASWIEGTSGAASGHFVANYAAYADALKPGAHVDGVDLRGRDLAAYYRAATAICASDKTVCLNGPEQAIFDKLLIPLAQQRGDYILLATSYGRSGIISHEILHAQYFLFPKYRAVVDCYFEQTLSERARDEVRADLADSYDIANGFLLRNEFQAYLLQTGDTVHLPHLRASDRPALLHVLREAGGFPVMPWSPQP